MLPASSSGHVQTTHTNAMQKLPERIFSLEYP